MANNSRKNVSDREGYFIVIQPCGIRTSRLIHRARRDWAIFTSVKHACVRYHSGAYITLKYLTLELNRRACNGGASIFYLLLAGSSIQIQ